MVWAREVDDDMGGFQFMDNTTSAVINSLKFDVAKQVRSMIIILAGFNVAMAFVLAVIIFRNGYKATQKSDPAFGFRYFSPVSLPNAELPSDAAPVHPSSDILRYQKCSHSSYPLA